MTAKSRKIACVVGAGASSFALLQTLVNKEEYDKIYLVTTGSFDEISLLNDPDTISPDMAQNNMFSIIPEKRLFGSSRIYERSDSQHITLDGYEIKTSHQISGLVNVWGANVCFPTKNDFELYPELLNYQPYFKHVADLLKVSGDSTWVSGESDYSEPFDLFRSSRANKFNSLARKIKSMNFRAGSSILAVNAKDGDSHRCNPCGDCISGCRRGSIFNLYREYSDFLIKNSNRVTLLEESKVNKIEHYDGLFEVEYEKQVSGERVDLKCDRVFLCAGVFDNALILLRSNLSCNSRIRVLDSNKYYFISLRLSSVNLSSESRIGALSESFFQYDTKHGTIHCQIYPSTNLLTSLFHRVGFIKKLLRFFSIGMIYLPSNLSNSISAELSDGGSMTLKKSKEKFLLRWLYLIRLACKSWIKLIPCGLVMIPYFKSCPTGNSQHSGAITNSTGFIPHGLYLVDTSGLPYVPGTPTTALAMAQAMYIGNHHD